MKRILITALPSLMAVNFLIGCSMNILDPGWDFTRDAEGNRVIADTPRMWYDFRASVDSQVQREIDSVDINQSWIGYWEHRLWLVHKDGGEHHSKYLAYMVCTRRRFDLPALSDQWEERFDDRWCEYFLATEGRHTRGLPDFARRSKT